MRLLSFCLRLSLSPPARREFFALRDGERASSPTPKTLALRRPRRVASWRFSSWRAYDKTFFFIAMQYNVCRIAQWSGQRHI